MRSLNRSMQSRKIKNNSNSVMNMNQWIRIVVGTCLCLLVSAQIANACTDEFNGQNFGWNAPITVLTSDGDTYSVNICGDGILCSSFTTASVCQKHASSFFPLGTENSGSFKVSGSSVMYETQVPGNLCSDSGLPRKSQIFFDCNATSPTPPNQMTVQPPAAGPSGSCTWIFHIQSKEACAAAASGGGGSDGGSGKLSGGWIFVIIFIVVTFVYFIGGAAYMRFRKGATGLEMCPNREFWKDLFPLVKDGFVYSFGKCRGLCSGGGSTTGSYSNI